MIVNLALIPLGTSLSYLRGTDRGYWEALLRLPLPSHTNTIRYAVGFGTDRNPATALSQALDALERDPQIHEQSLANPTCAPDSLDIALANLLTQSTITPSPPKFKLKA